MTKLTGFAAACYDTNTRAELEYAAGFPSSHADEDDCAEWKLSVSEWHAAIGQALAAKRADYAELIAAVPGTPELVWTSVDSLDELPEALWTLRIIETASEAKTLTTTPLGFGRIKLLGVRVNGVTTIEYATSPYSCGQQRWTRVSPWHVPLAKFFISKLDARPEGGVLCQFFDRVESPGLADLVRFSIAEHVADAEGNDVDACGRADGLAGRAANHLTNQLRGLGVPAGDWVYSPLLNTFKS